VAEKKAAAKKAPAKSAATKTAVKKAPATKALAAKKAEPTHQQIAALAEKFYHERGGHHGTHEQDWLRAERELRGH
jgi:hypothetical protein